MTNGIYRITETFEEEICKYTGSPYCVTVDNCSNALFLALYREGISGKEIEIPNRTYPSVPCAILHAGGKVKFRKLDSPYLTGAYKLKPTNIWDASLTFTHDMYQAGNTMCLSFTGPYKHLKLGKGGAILTDSYEDYLWFKRARFSGRRECSYLNDNLDMLGWNFYLLPEISVRGIQLMSQFYDRNGEPISTTPKTMKYPDLSTFPIYGG